MSLYNFCDRRLSGFSVLYETATSDHHIELKYFNAFVGVWWKFVDYNKD